MPHLAKDRVCPSVWLSLQWLLVDMPSVLSLLVVSSLVTVTPSATSVPCCSELLNETPSVRPLVCDSVVPTCAVPYACVPPHAKVADSYPERLPYGNCKANASSLQQKHREQQARGRHKWHQTGGTPRERHAATATT